MDMERYRTLLRVLELGSLSAAADALGYTASGVSRMMAALEADHGFPLLVRRRDGVEATRECEALLEDIREAVFAAHRLRQHSDLIRGAETGEITIGLAYHAWFRPLCALAEDFRRLYPGITIRYESGYSIELLQKLQRREVDCCFISRRKGDHEWLPIRQDPLLAMVPPSHPLAQRDSVPLTAFAQEPFIEMFAGIETDNANAFAQYHIRPNTKYTISDVHAAWAMVESGLGISMNNALNSRLWDGEVKHLPLDPPVLVEIGLAWQKDCGPATKQFLTFGREEMGSWGKRP